MSKINKLGKSTFVIAILSFILVAVLAFGGTYAYFSDTATGATTGNIKVGTLKFDAAAANWSSGAVKVTSDDKVVPGQPIINGAAEIEVATTTNVNYYVRALVVETIDLADDHENEPEDARCPDYTVVLVENTAENSSWIKGSGNYYYLTAVQKPGTTGYDATISFAIEATINPNAGQKGSEHFMDATVSYTVTFEIVQADYILDGVDEGADITGGAEGNLSKVEAAFNTALTAAPGSIQTA